MRVCHVRDGQEPGLCGCAPVTQICALKWRSAGCLPVRDHAAMLLPPSQAAAPGGREREVVALIAEEISSAGIAQRVVLSPLTVKTHASHAMTKAGARTAPSWWSWPVSTGWRRFPPGMTRSPRALVPGSH